MEKRSSKYSTESPEVWVPSSEEDAKREVPFLIKLFKKYGNVKSVLDVGCGKGRHAYLLSRQGYNCEGIEPHPKMVEYAQKHYPEVTYKVNSMQNIKYENNFDAIICIFSIIVFNKSNEEAIRTLTNFYRALKKGGIAIIETYNAINWLANNSFREHFVDIDKKEGIKTIVKEKINSNNQSYISERTYYNIKNSKKVGSFTKESRMFFPLELKFFLESARFKVLTMLSSDSLSKMTLKDTKLDKRRLLVVVKKVN